MKNSTTPTLLREWSEAELLMLEGYTNPHSVDLYHGWSEAEIELHRQAIEKQLKAAKKSRRKPRFA